MPTDPSTSARTPGSDAAAPDVEGHLRADHDRQVGALAQLEAEFAILLADPSVLQEDRDTTRLLLERSREAVAASEQALGRVVDGTYGACVVCGAPIPPERLEAVPDATTCVACVAPS